MGSIRPFDPLKDETLNLDENFKFEVGIITKFLNFLFSELELDVLSQAILQFQGFLNSKSPIVL